VSRRRRSGGAAGGGGDVDGAKKGRPPTVRAAERSVDTAVVEVPELTSAAAAVPLPAVGRRRRSSSRDVVILPRDASRPDAADAVRSTWTWSEVQGALKTDRNSVRRVEEEDNTIDDDDDGERTTRRMPANDRSRSSSTASTSAAARATADDEDVGRGGAFNFAALSASLRQKLPGQRTSPSSPAAPLGLFKNKKEATAVWTLGLLFLSYCHASSAGFILPALLPSIAGDVEMTDAQGALLTTLFTVCYSFALPLAGSMADHVDRKALLAAGAAVWSVATFATGHADGYADLCVSRALYAVGQSVQNPVAYAMIPELFPRTKVGGGCTTMRIQLTRIA
jgi:hypothetical protein